MLLPWQDQIWQRFNQSMRSGMPHAILLNGPRGIGKYDFATFLAHAMLCQQVRADNSPCGVCKQCLLLAAGTHSDLKTLQPESNSNVVKIDAIRDLVDFAHQSSLQGGRKVVILEPAENLNVNAANALLKTLEEPPASMFLILVSHSSGRLLATIRSRCQRLDFPVPDENVARSWLIQALHDRDMDISDEQAEVLWEISGGRPMLALEYAENQAHQALSEMVEELGAVLRSRISGSLVAERWADDYARSRLSWMVFWLESIIRIKLANQALSIQLPQAEKIFGYLAKTADVRQLYALHDMTLAQIRLFSGPSNPNPVLLFEHLLNHWKRLMPASM